MKKNNFPSKIFFAFYCIWMAVLLLTPIQINFSVQRKTNLVPFHTIKLFFNHFIREYFYRFKNGDISFFQAINNVSVVNLLANVVLFLPIGFFLPRFIKMQNPFKAFIISLIIPIFIECWQYIFCPTRSFDVDDILLNFLGIFIAYIFHSIFFRKNARE